MEEKNKTMILLLSFLRYRKTNLDSKNFSIILFSYNRMLDSQSLMEYVKHDAENLKHGIGKEWIPILSNIWLSVEESCRADFTESVNAY